MRRAIFMDRDGTISDEVGYVNHISRFKLMDGVAEAIKLINDSDYLAVAVTNQAGVARGYFKEELILKVHKKMETLLREKGAYLDGIYYCPHHPDVGEEPYRQNCNCRKPKTGMLEAAHDDLGIDLKKSFVIGDKISDVDFAHRAGAKGILVLTGYGRGEHEALAEYPGGTEPDHVAEDLLSAVKWITENY